MTRFTSISGAITLGLAALVSVDAKATSLGMIEGTAIEGPSGYYALCSRSPALCPSVTGDGRPHSVRLTRERMKELDVVNRRMNAAIQPVEDHIQFGVADVWGMPTNGRGDCEDYVLAKRDALIGLGWSPQSLLIGVAIGTDAPYHAVLVARTDRGEFVLDNLSDEVRDWRKAGLHFVIRQSSRNPRAWVLVENGSGARITATGATR